MRSLALALAVTGIAVAAPLEMKNRPAEDAVRLLREHGLVENYPDGQYKGDRAMSRWEVAMLVARTLALHEGRITGILSKAELQELQNLVNDLQPELEGLGVRVSNLEQKTEQLDGRVTELERIKFSGQVITNFISQRFYNTGNRLGGPGGLDYDQAVGSTLGSNLVPHAPTGIVPALDMLRGRQLTNGRGFSSTLYLNAAAQITDDITADLRIFAYTSQGNSVVDAVWGAPPPYLANPFTGAGYANAQGINRAPFTTMGFDRLRVTHQPSSTTLTLGSYLPRVISPQVYTGMVNPRVGDPRFLESFGFHVTGDSGPFQWEAFGTYLPDGNPVVGAGIPPYRNEAFGAAVSYRQDGFTAGGNFLRAAAQASQGLPLFTGLANLVNGDTGQVNVNWVNPPEFSAAVLPADQSAGLGSTSDKRPISGIGFSDAPGGNFGPQGITLGSVNLGYRGDIWNVGGEIGFSSYKPNRNSAYTSEGRLYRFGGGVSLFENTLDLTFDYRHTDPTYDPMILVYPGTAAGLTPFRAYHRFPDHDQFWHLYSLHDTEQFAHNRRGFWLGAKWKYNDAGTLNFHYRNMEQVKTSLQDVRYGNVLGFSPGFFDALFREFSRSSFDANLQPRENPRGSMEAFQIEWNHSIEETPFSLSVSFDNFHFFRPTQLSVPFGGSQNFVDLTNQAGRFRFGYTPTPHWGMGVGYEFGSMRGHYDPFGVYNNYAQATSRVDFRNRDVFQHIPFVDFNWNIAENLKFDAGFRYYMTEDRVPTSVFAGPATGPASTAHPFQFDGYQLNTRLELNF